MDGARLRAEWLAAYYNHDADRVLRAAAQLEERAKRANAYTAGWLIEIARELRKIAGAE